MNKILSQALKKAVSEYSPEVKEVPKGNRPDLFSLNNETELFQNDKGIIIKIDRSRDVNLTDFGKATLKDRYLGHNESFQDLFARVASSYADDNLHAQRIYNYISNLWFMPATPVLSNGGTKRGLPISCFLNEASDSLGGILDLWSENVWLAAKGGGIGSYWGNLRSIGEKIGKVGKTSGIIPFIKVMDSLTMAISQGSLRRGSAACYLPVDHPEIEEFIEMRRPTGGDPNRKALNLHHGVLVSDSFMRAVENDEQWGLKSPADGTVQQTISARNLWIRLLTARIETGEPYIIYIDTVNRLIPQHHKLANLTVKTSNLCSEITLPTGIDKDGRDRTAVCCLSSLNLEKYDEWKDDPDMIGDVMREEKIKVKEESIKAKEAKAQKNREEKERIRQEQIRIREIERKKRLDEEQKIREAARKLKYEEEKLRETENRLRQLEIERQQEIERQLFKEQEKQKAKEEELRLKEQEIKTAEKEKLLKEKEQRDRAEELRKEEEEKRKIEEERELAFKHQEEEEERIKEENRRIKEWEDKFDKEQKIREEELIKKFYSKELDKPNINEEKKDSETDFDTKSEDKNNNN